MSSNSNRKTWSCDSVSPRSTTTGGGITRRTADILRITNSYLSVGSTGRRTATSDVSADSERVRRATRSTTGSHEPSTYLERDGQDEVEVEDFQPEDIEVVHDRGYKLTAETKTIQHAVNASEAHIKDSDRSLSEELNSARVSSFDGQGHFVPRSELERILSPDVIRNELRRTNPYIHDDQINSTTQFIASHPRIFAILTLIGKQSLIQEFIKAGISDEALPIAGATPQRTSYQEPGSSEDNGEQRLVLNSPLWNAEIDELFKARQWEVLAPVFTNSSSKAGLRLWKLTVKDVLPFVTEDDGTTSQVEGAFSRVSKVMIHPSHLNLTDSIDSGPDWCGIKEIKTSHFDFTQEFNALQKIQARTKHERHLTPAYASYQHGNKFYFVFPWADGGNLREFWAKNYHNLPIHEKRTRWLAEQILGLTRALRTLHSVDHARHGDLKPENILYFRNGNDNLNQGVLKIADFGLTRFSNSANSIYKERRHTPRYRAPEFDLNRGRSTQAYDVWSLGCVFLEFITWYSYGSTVDLDHTVTAAQIFDRSKEEIDDSFFTIKENEITGTRRAEVKPSIAKWFTTLRDLPTTTPFFLSVLDIIDKKMLVVDETQRATAAECFDDIEDAFMLMSEAEMRFSNHLLIKELPESTNPRRVVTVESIASTRKRSITKIYLERLDASSYRTSYADKMKMFIEQVSGRCIDWYPLKPVNRRKSNSVARLIWEYGGRDMSIFLDGPRFDYYKDRIPLKASNGPILPTANASQHHPSSTTPQNPQSFWRLQLSHVKKLPFFWRKSSRTPSATTPSQSSKKQKSTDWKELYFCLDSYWTPIKQTQMYTIPSIESLQEDYDLFVLLRNSLPVAQGSKLSRYLSWRTCTRVQLAKFTFLFNNNSLVKAHEHKKDGIVIAKDFCQGYEYTCIDDLDVHEHMEVMADTILQGLQNPELGRNGRAVIDGIPKLLAPPGLAKKQHKSGWGFYASHGLCLLKMSCWIVATLLLGAIFVPIWLSRINSTDLQNAFIPFQSTTGVLALILVIVVTFDNF